MAGLQPEDTSWEPWTKLKFDYNLEDKVILEAHGDVRISNIQEETKEQTKEQEADAEQQGGAEKEEGQRPKREIHKPPYLRDFVSK